MKNKKFIFKVLIGSILFLGTVFFFTNQWTEVKSSIDLIKSSSFLWITVGILFTLIYIAMQGYVYVVSYKVVRANLSIATAIKLFLKRNFLGVFLPAGGFTSLAFFRNETEKDGISKESTDFASLIYTISSLLSLFFLSLIIILFWGTKGLGSNFLFLFGGSVLLWGAILLYGFSFYRQGWCFKITVKYFPAVEGFYEKLVQCGISLSALISSFFWALMVEAIGIIHLYIAMLALGLEPSLEGALVVYTVATLFYCFSPFMKGVGIVEMSMTLLLCGFGYSEQQAISISLLYRLFEFWGPLALGAISFFLNRDNIFIRLIPSLFILMMGVINIIFVFRPAVYQRDHYLGEIFTDNLVNLSNAAILFSGILLIMCSAFLIRGLRLAWFIASLLCLVTASGNLFRGLDYQEGLLAFLVLGILCFSYKHYFVPNRKDLSGLNISLVLWITGVTLLYGILGFYFLNENHFNMDFSLRNAIVSTWHGVFLLNSGIADPQTIIGQNFLYSLNLLGLISLSVLMYWAVNPVFKKEEIQDSHIELAKSLLLRYGRSPVDYFKTYGDKNLYFNDSNTGFIAYKRSFDFAVVLEGPVCADDHHTSINLIQSFETFCRVRGLKTAYYRVDQRQLDVFKQLGKKHFLIGEEAIVNVNMFSLEGKKRKSLRNAVNSIEKKGYSSHIYRAPISNGLVQKLKSVSDNWLQTMKRSERIFSQGMFEESKIKDSNIITLEDQEGKIWAFLNIIPNYAPNEATYDLIRKLQEAPGGNMDILLLKFLEYCRTEGFPMLNMGLVPFSGLEKKKGMIEKILYMLYRNSNYFRNARGLRDFKEKFDPLWVEKYLVYSHHLDLISVPLAIDKAMKAK